jgi:hypothetical protein
MAAATPAQLRAAIAAYLAAQIPGLHCSTDGQTNVEAPAAVVLPAVGKYLDYAQSMAPDYATYDAYFRVLVLISQGDVRSMTPQLDGYLSHTGTNSIVAALARDPTVGGVADYVHPVEATWSGSVEWEGIQYMAGQILLEVAAQ